MVSACQDIITMTTKGRWLVAKQCSLVMAVWHMTAHPVARSLSISQLLLTYKWRENMWGKINNKINLLHLCGTMMTLKKSHCRVKEAHKTPMENYSLGHS